MASDAHLIRAAVAADVEPLVRTLVRAFENYPMTKQGLDPDGYLDRLERYQRLLLTRIGLAHGKVWTSDDHSAVAVWRSPSTPRGVFGPLASELHEIAGERALVAQAYEQAMGVLRPRVPTWFLTVVGVDPSRQGCGLGRAVIAPGLACADKDGSPAFLETQDAANVGFYESLGFEIVGEIALPHEGPTHWAMRRPPRL